MRGPSPLIGMTALAAQRPCRRGLLVFTVVLLFACFSSLAQTPKESDPAGIILDRGIAQVGRETVTWRDLSLRAAIARLEDSSLRSATEEEIAALYLPRAVSSALLYQHLWRPDAEPNEELARELGAAEWGRLAALAGSNAALERHFAAEGITAADARSWIQEQAVREAVVSERLAMRLGPEFFNQAEDTPAHATAFRVSQIFIRAASDSARHRDAARRRAFTLRADLAEGLAFAEAAAVFSDDPPSAGRGGETGWIEADSLAPEIAETLRDLRPGQVSQPVQVADGWLLLKLEDYDTALRARLREERAQLRARLLEQSRQEMDVRVAPWARKAADRLDFPRPVD